MNKQKQTKRTKRTEQTKQISCSVQLPTGIADRTTLIIKLIEHTDTKDRAFVINRSCTIDQVLRMSKRLSTWYEFESAGALKWFTASEYQILEELPYPNYKRGDQKIINEYKRKYIENIDINEENEVLCNQLFVDYTRNTNKWLQDKYYSLFGQYILLTQNDIYKAVKQLWFSSAKRYLNLPRYRLVAMISAMDEDCEYYNAMLAAIFLKPYLKNRMVHREYLPFPSFRIANIIYSSYIENCITKKQTEQILKRNL